MFNSEELKNTFRSLKYRNFRLYFTGQSISLLGTWIQRITMPWLVYHLTGSALLLGIVGFAGQIPTFILSPFAGALTDRYYKYKLLIVTQILSMIQALLLAFLYFLKIINVWHILVLSIFLGCINAFDMPGRQSFIIKLIDNKNDLGNAIALNSTIVNIARLLGPSLAGILIATTNEGICFLINGLSYIFVIASLLSMNVKEDEINNNENSIWQDIKDGFKYVYSNNTIRSILLLLGLISLMGMPYTVLMPVFVKKILLSDSYTFGFLMGATGIGALIGTIYLASQKNIENILKLITLSAGIFGFGLIAFSFSRHISISIILMIIIGFGMILNMASSNTMLQTLSEDNFRGRVMSFYTMAFMGTAPFGSLLAGSMASSIGVANTILISGIICVIGSIIYGKNLQVQIIRDYVKPIIKKLALFSIYRNKKNNI